MLLSFIHIHNQTFYYKWYNVDSQMHLIIWSFVTLCSIAHLNNINFNFDLEHEVTTIAIIFRHKLAWSIFDLGHKVTTSVVNLEHVVTLVVFQLPR